MMWRKLALVIVPAVILILIGFFMYFHHPHRAAATAVASKHPVSSTAPAAAKLQEAPVVTSVKSAQKLAGMQVWMQDGYLFDYFPYRHGRVDYGKSAGLVPPMQPMKIEKIVTQRKPRGVKTHVPGGREQVLAVFTSPGSQGTYALPIGYTAGKQAEFYSGQMFYYNNPHQIYAYWPQKAWTAIGKHEAVQGMTELQTEAALGANEKVKAGKNGEQTVTYNTGKKKWSVTFKEDKAVAVKQS